MTVVARINTNRLQYIVRYHYCVIPSRAQVSIDCVRLLFFFFFGLCTRCFFFFFAKADFTQVRDEAGRGTKLVCRKAKTAGDPVRMFRQQALTPQPFTARDCDCYDDNNPSPRSSWQHWPREPAAATICTPPTLSPPRRHPQRETFRRRVRRVPGNYVRSRIHAHTTRPHRHATRYERAVTASRAVLFFFLFFASLPFFPVRFFFSSRNQH